ncbi:hypothetical protein AMTR_s00138p00110930 [Amborella trichopoda]|uniref:Uncharacterized protein n=1 Tax=Amborella trichopoda TaxID=13333 RepID=W1NER0_AMBTC|nr:hypothetical protein AMTR_s00138p00110930 [Amborella trichopoda]
MSSTRSTSAHPPVLSLLESTLSRVSRTRSGPPKEIVARAPEAIMVPNFRQLQIGARQEEAHLCPTAQEFGPRR